MARRRDEHKSIFDPIHGIVDLDARALDLVAHRAFQRLWGIRQTGFAHLVFPGANHTRLEHSLGVFWVAGAMADALALTAGDRATVTAGALLHDVGHGPFSHTFDPTMREVLGFGHESISRAWILGNDPAPPPAGEDGPSIPELLERHDVRPSLVADLVDPRGAGGRHRLLRSILHGPIDADRIDYLQRDAHYTGVAHGTIDAVRLLATARAHARRLVFAAKGRSAVEGFLVGRALMYASVYYHKTVRSAEVMAQAAVERGPGYPESARPLLTRTDGQLFARLETAGGLPGHLAACVEGRRLYKQAFGWRSVDASLRRTLGRLRSDPVERRAWEDRFANRLHAPPGSILLDLAGLEVRDENGEGWPEVALLDGTTLTHPFRAGGPWRAFTDRPPSLWAASVYADPRFRESARRRLAAGRDELP